VYIASDPRRSLASFLGLTPTPYLPSPKSFPLISFTDPHPLTLLESYRFKNSGGGCIPDLSTFQAFQRADLPRPHKPFTCNTYNLTQVSQTKDLRQKLSCLDATLTKNRGRGPAFRRSGIPILELILFCTFPFLFNHLREPILQPLSFQIHPGMGGTPIVSTFRRLDVPFRRRAIIIGVAASASGKKARWE
jgi:hypothetical protein